jgi:hypothetical protein
MIMMNASVIFTASSFYPNLIFVTKAESAILRV